MKKKLSLAFAVTLFFAAHETAHAQRISPMPAGKFGRMCSAPAGRTACDAYISGMADAVALSAVSAHNEGNNSAPESFCVPVSETTDAMRNKVLTWLKGHTDTLSRPVGEGVFRALHDSYPCSAKK